MVALNWGVPVSLPCLFLNRRKNMNESHLRIRNGFFRTPEFIEFAKRRKFLVYYFLETSIVRGSEEVKNIHHGAHYIYKKFFCKNQLGSRYSQEKMGEYLGTSQSRISKNLKELEQDGFIKKIIRPIQKGNILYYQFGTWVGEYGEKNYKETIWLDEHFTKIYDDTKKFEAENKRKDAAIALMDFYDDWIDYINILKTASEVELDELKILWDEKKRTKDYAI